jgi:hypothetical protein
VSADDGHGADHDHEGERLLPDAAGRVPPPGPSFLKEQAVRLPVGAEAAGASERWAGMARPANPADDWWMTYLWVFDRGGLVAFTDLAPVAGPPPEPPVARLGPSLAGGLSGLILEDAGRLQMMLAPGFPPADPERPWRTPALVRAAFRFEPARAATMRPNELASEVLTAFRRAAEGLGRR